MTETILDTASFRKGRCYSPPEIENVYGNQRYFIHEEDLLNDEAEDVVLRYYPKVTLEDIEMVRQTAEKSADDVYLCIKSLRVYVVELEEDN